MTTVLVRSAALFLIAGVLPAGAQDELDDVPSDQPPAEAQPAEAQPAEAHPEGTLETIEVKDREAAPHAAASRRPAIEEIVVTAQKREENVQDVPIAISALSREDIEDRQITGIGDIVAQSPGFKFGEIIGVAQVSMRGVGFGLISGTGENSVAIHSDGVYVPRPAAVNMLYEDLGGAEVLRGPQGTLYGRNATGGVLNLISVAPPEESEFEASLGYGELDQRRVKLSGGTGLFDRRLRMRLSGLLDDMRDDYFINVEFPGRDMGARKLTTGRLSADFSATDTLEFQLRAFRAAEDFGGVHFAAYKPPPDSAIARPGTFSDDPYTTRNNEAGRTEKDLDFASLKGGYELNAAWSVTSLTGWSKFRGANARPQDADGTANDVEAVTRDDRDHTLTQELLVGFDGDALQWTSGLFYLDETFNPYSEAAAQNLVFVFDSVEPTESYAAFSDATWRALEALQLYAGLRYMRENKSQVLTLKTVESQTGQANIQCENLVTQLNSETVTGRLGAQYEWATDIMTYGQFARGFKAGGFSLAACGDTFLPEEVDAYEIGLKSTLLEGSLRLNGAAFVYEYTNLQVENVVGTNLFVYNAQAQVEGVELETLWVPAAAWELSANLTYLDAVYTEFVNTDTAASPAAQQPEDLSGNRLNRSPEWTVGGAVDYRVELGGWGGLSLRADGIYETDYFLREFNNQTDRQEAHGIYNAFVNYELPGGSLTLRSYVKNITNEPVLGGLVAFNGYKMASFNPPRLWGVGIDYRFGS